MKLTFLFVVLFFSSCSLRNEVVVGSKDGVTIYGITREELPRFFQNNRIMVARASAGSENASVFTVHYPSVNFAPSPMYSHRIGILVSEDVPITVKEVARSHNLVILRETAEVHVWELVGFVEKTAHGDHFDWFNDKYLYRYQADLDHPRHDTRSRGGNSL